MAAGLRFGRGGQESRGPRDSGGGAGLPLRVLWLAVRDLPAFGLSRTGFCCWSSGVSLSGRSGCCCRRRLRLHVFRRRCIGGRCRPGSCTHSGSGSRSRRRHHGHLLGFSREYSLCLARVAAWVCNLQIVKAPGGTTAGRVVNAHSRPPLRSGRGLAAGIAPGKARCGRRRLGT